MPEVEDINRAVIDRLVAAFNSLDRAAFDSCYADPLVIHTQNGDVTMNHEDHWQSVLDTFAVFPDHEAQLLGLMASDDHVFQYWEYSGSDTGVGVRGRAPTGKRAVWRAFSDYRFENGVIVEATQIHDSMAMYLQLGLIDLDHD